MRNTYQTTLAAAAITLAVTAFPVTSKAYTDEENGTVTNCHSTRLDAAESRTWSRNFVEREPGLVIVRADKTNYDLKIIDSNDEVVCESIGAEAQKQSCIWVSNDHQNYRAEVTNTAEIDGGEGGDDGEGEGEGAGADTAVELELCFINEEG